MAADNISNIIDVTGFNQELDAVLTGITKLEGSINAANEKVITVKVDMQNAPESLQAVSDGMNKLQSGVNDLRIALSGQKDIMSQLSAANQRYGTDMGQALLYYAELKTKIFENNSAMYSMTQRVNDAAAGIEKLKSLGISSGQVFNDYTAILSKNKEAIQPLIIANKQLGDEVTKTNQVISGAVAKRITDTDNAEQAAAIKNKNRIDARKQQDADLLLKQEALANSYNAMMLAQAEKDEVNALKFAVSNKNKEIAAADLLLKQIAYGEAYIALLENEGIAEQIAAIKNKNTIDARNARETRAFNIAWEQGEKWQAQQTKLANSTSSAAEKQTFAYQALTKAKNMAYRFPALLAEIAVLTLLFEAVSAVGKAIMESIPGTDAYIAKQEKITQATDTLKNVLISLGDAIDENNQKEQKSFNEELGIKARIDAVKREESAIKAKGITKNAIYDAEKDQHEISQKRRQEETDALGKQITIYSEIKDALESMQHGAGLQTSSDVISTIKGRFKESELPQDVIDKVKADIDKSLKDKGSMANAIDGAILDYGAKTYDLKNKKNNVDAEGSDEEIKEKARIAKVQNDKEIELKKQTHDTIEQLRQANEKEDIESVDKIVADTKAKYKSLASDILKSRELYRLSVTSESDKGYTDKNIKAYDNILSLLRKIGDQERRNSEYELSGKQYSSYTNARSTLAGGAAEIAKDANGLPNYNKSATAIDLETNAKKEALKNQFIALASQIEGSDQVIEAQKQLDEKLLLIDKQAYKERLDIAQQYFEQIAAKIDATTANLSSENNARHFGRLSSILKGRGNQQNQDLDLFLEEKENIKANAQIGLQGIREKLPAAQEAFTKADNATKGPLSLEAARLADAAKTSMLQDLNDLKKAEKEYQSQIDQADNDIWQKKREGLEDIKNLTIQLAQQTAETVKEITDNQIEGELQQLAIKRKAIDLTYEQQVAAINATAGYQITKENQLAKLAAQHADQQNELQTKENQLNLKKARADKEAAEAGIFLNTALAIAKTLPMLSNPITATIGAVEIALITAIGAAQYAAAASVPLPQYRYGTDNHPGGMAIIGEAGEREFVSTPSGASFWSKPEATLIDLERGSTVTPMHQFMERARRNAAKYDISESAAIEINSKKNEEKMYQYIADVYSKQTKEMTNNIVEAIFGSRSRPVNIRPIAEEMRKQKNLQ